MKKHFIAFMMPFLTLATGFAQEAAQDVPVKQDTKEISYWTDPASGDKRLLNKSKSETTGLSDCRPAPFIPGGPILPVLDSSTSSVPPVRCP